MSTKQIYQKVLKVIKQQLELAQDNTIIKELPITNDKPWVYKFTLKNGIIKCKHTMRANPKLSFYTYEINIDDPTNLNTFANLFFDEIKAVINNGKPKNKATDPSCPLLAEQCIDAIFLGGRR